MQLIRIFVLVLARSGNGSGSQQNRLLKLRLIRISGWPPTWRAQGFWAWLTPDSLAVLYGDPDSGRQVLRFASYDGARWNTEDVSLGVVASPYGAKLYGFGLPL